MAKRATCVRRKAGALHKRQSPTIATYANGDCRRHATSGASLDRHSVDSRRAVEECRDNKGGGRNALFLPPGTQSTAGEDHLWVACSKSAELTFDVLHVCVRNRERSLARSVFASALGSIKPWYHLPSQHFLLPSTPGGIVAIWDDGTLPFNIMAPRPRAGYHWQHFFQPFIEKATAARWEKKPKPKRGRS